jgi:uncharacterized protein YjdB
LAGDNSAAPNPTSSEGIVNRKRLQIIAMACAMAVVATSCKKHGGYMTEPTVAVEAIKVTPQVIQFVTIGQSQQVVASIGPVNATDRSIRWESTDPAVASVDSVGRVTAKAVGSGVFITAYSHDGLHQASVNVSVNP